MADGLDPNMICRTSSDQVQDGLMFQRYSPHFIVDWLDWLVTKWAYTSVRARPSAKIAESSLYWTRRLLSLVSYPCLRTSI